VETLFGAEGRYPASVIKLELASWDAPIEFAELLQALAVLHNRVLVLRKCKGVVKKGQLLHPALYLPADELLIIKSFPADGRPFEFYAYPTIARTVATFLAEVAASSPANVPFKTLISLFKDELEILKKRRYREDQIRRLLKLDVLREGLKGARVSLEEPAEETAQ
jgi:hypothetical protein